MASMKPSSLKSSAMVEDSGRLNHYQCSGCSKITVTINVDSGVTLYGIQCPECGSLALYYVPKRNVNQEPEFEWYAPDRLEWQRLATKLTSSGASASGMFRHFVNGGLYLRPVVKLEDESIPKLDHSYRVVEDAASMSAPPFVKAKFAKEMPDFDTLKVWITRCPRTYIPALLRILVVRALNSNVYTMSGLMKAVSNAVDFADDVSPMFREERDG